MIGLESFFKQEMRLARQPDCTSLSDVLALVESRFGEALLDAKARSALHFISSHVPVRHSYFWGIEIPLDDPAPRADFLWQVDRDSAELFKRLGRESGNAEVELAGDLRRQSSFWREFDRFEEEWVSSPEWRRLLLNIWFEVDAASAPFAMLGERLDRPNVFWGPVSRETGADRDLLRLLPALGRRFYGTEMEAARIETITDTIPDGSQVFQMGIMGARKLPTMRICMKNPDTKALERWLAEIEWPGSRTSLRDTLDWLRPLSSEIALNVDFLPEKTGENLGIEIYVAEPGLSIDNWLPLFDQLLARRLARADKLAALRNAPWSQRFRQLWVWLRNPPIGYPLLFVNLHHLKLVLRGDELVKAKAYVGVYFPAIRYDTELAGRQMEEFRDHRRAPLIPSRAGSPSDIVN